MVVPAKARVAVEALGAAGVSFVALSINTGELTIAITAVSALVAIVVWLVRLEGRVNLQAVLLERIDRRLEKLSGEAE